MTKSGAHVSNFYSTILSGASLLETVIKWVLAYPSSTPRYPMLCVFCFYTSKETDNVFLTIDFRLKDERTVWRTIGLGELRAERIEMGETQKRRSIGLST